MVTLLNGYIVKLLNGYNAMKYGIEINQRVGKKIEKKWVSKIIRSALKQIGIKDAEISIAVVGDKEMRALNKQWRRKDRVTDVLSFDFRVFPRCFPRFSASTINGEIIICYPQALRQAKESKHSVKEEIKLLLIHGLLHLCGYDHEKSKKEAKKWRIYKLKLLNC